MIGGLVVPQQLIENVPCHEMIVLSLEPSVGDVSHLYFSHWTALVNFTISSGLPPHFSKICIQILHHATNITSGENTPNVLSQMTQNIQNTCSCTWWCLYQRQNMLCFVAWNTIWNISLKSKDLLMSSSLVAYLKSSKQIP